MKIPKASAFFSHLPQYLRRHRLITAWLRFTREDPVQLVPITGGVSGYADLREGFLRLILIEGGFEREFFDLARNIFPRNGVFFDVGANFGLMSVGLVGAVAPAGSYHLFEPNPLLTPIIAQSLARLGKVDAKIINAAVSDSTEPLFMQFIASHTGASHVSHSGVSVPAVRLDDYIRENRVKRVDLMKVDVEGYEASVLKSMPDALKNGSVRVIYFEYVRKWIERYGDADDVLDLLSRSGFKIFYCRKHDFDAAAGSVVSLTIAGGSSPVSVVELDPARRPLETDLLAVHQTALGQS